MLTRLSLFGLTWIRTINCTLLWAIWTHRNDVIFWNLHPNPTAIVERANNIMSEIFRYNRNTNFSSLVDFAGLTDKIASNSRKSKVWQPPPAELLKWNINASRIEQKQSTTISYVCKNSNGHIICAIGKKIRDHTILVAEALPIRDAINKAIQKQMEQIVIESDFLATV